MVKAVETFESEDAEPSQRFYARVVHPGNGKELTRTSEGYEHEADAVHAVIASAHVVSAALLTGQLEEPYPKDDPE
jgi:uncharacterized protein YegP (UPF0339 family)